MTYSNKILF